MEHLSWCGATEKTLGNFKESVTAEAAMQESGQLDTFPILGTHVHGNLFFSACMMILSLLGSALLIS
jgi:hypothetical protein